MKGKNWREYEPQRIKKKRRRRRKGGLPIKLILLIFLFAVGYAGFEIYFHFSKPYIIGLDAGHGGVDTGAVGIIEEVALTEKTTAKLAELLEADGRFRVVLSRKDGEDKTVTDRNKLFQRAKPDLVLSIHANSGEDASAYGFECYPSPPGKKNYERSLAFAQYIAMEMKVAGARLRGPDGVRFGYYVPDETGNTSKLLIDSTDTQVYDYDTFGMLKNMTCPAVLVEQCFVTNEQDVKDFGTEEGCAKAAQAYYQGICQYLSTLEKGKS
ncbi:N-acetylmuramoyl-L-alanine amidase family protein [Anaerotignum propionicum]|uniref:N-acetylmuramoyl-L-alanine amidase n=1 Tax=Anaerotignum propionicum DSM 1682 TaxID=991789 RepID=A0A0X8V7X8_ANAPI|nr:N-acetylmuramoyl-L-alanine amidase [Anaerotignum propionicum]AMJ39786.1 N-acetylmuramoyl-L-alanine amidase AmiB precursor [Anaerotignum propionicum DSM 1682]SHE28582.1 N-acetylmuramoyl-L-alanine amidase [[Clostridium] propionicum DSM 1682] [Anaerotignum propionicum DSM 1682]